jgi:hypothetical protein
VFPIRKSPRGLFQIQPELVRIQCFFSMKSAKELALCQWLKTLDSVNFSVAGVDF